MGFLSKFFELSKKDQNISPQEHEAMEEYVSSISQYTDDVYFSKLVTTENFPGYTITTQIHPRVFDSDAHPSCFPISYLFSRNDKPVLAVLVMQTNQYRAMIARGTYKILDDKGIKYIRFFKGFENKKSYVINRIASNLK